MNAKKMKSFVVLLLGTMFLASSGAFAFKTKKVVKKADPVVKMYVGPKLEDCQGERPMKCMMVRKSEQAQWEYFYAGIEGFKYKEGYNYLLLVKEVQIKNPPADGSAIRFVLVKQITKKKA
jgi:hypothetical protein